MSLVRLTIALVCLMASAAAISMKSSVFTNFIEKSCYLKDTQGRSYVLGQSGPAGPLGQSMENFISLIEKVEQSPLVLKWGPAQLAGVLLSRFHIEEYNYNIASDIFTQANNAKYRSRLREYLLNAATIHASDFPEDSLTEQEKCSMYFMLSHHLNKTAQQGDKYTYNQKWQSPVGRNIPARAKNVQLTANPREYGVVSLRNNEEHAIAPARVLFGIVGATSAVTSARVGDLIKSSSGLLEDIRKPEAEVNTLLAVTLGDILAYGSAPSDTETQSSKYETRFGARGKWNSTICQTSYILTTNSTRGSLAEIRGGIDGYHIAQTYIREMSSISKFRLSSLLRMYYSPYGLYDDLTSVCQRYNIGNKLNTLKDEAKNYMYAFVPIALNQAVEENRINDMVETTYRDWEDAVKQAMTSINEDSEWCETPRAASYSGSSSTANNQPCETPSDVVVMVDLEDEVEQQMDLVNKIATGLNMRRYGSSMTIVANTKGGGYDFHGTEGLSRIAWNSTDLGCVTCRLAWADRSNFGVQLGKSPDILFNNINSTLRDLKFEKDDDNGVPGKPFLFFNYGFAKKPTGDTNRFWAAKNELKTNHREVPLIVMGKGNRDDLDDFAYYRDDVIESDSPLQADLAKGLLNRICETPATLQHPKCRTETSSNVEFVGYVTRGMKQYWSMYPEFFLKSYTVTFEFAPVNGAIKVCYRRGTPKPEEDDRNCKTIKQGDEPQVFRSRNPCHKQSLSNCAPFYFTVIGIKDGTQAAQDKCKEEGCLHMEQIKWSVKHTGVSCNSAFKLASSLLIPLTLVITYISFYFSDRKF